MIEWKAYMTIGVHDFEYATHQEFFGFLLGMYEKQPLGCAMTYSIHGQRLCAGWIRSARSKIEDRDISLDNVLGKT